MAGLSNISVYRSAKKKIPGGDRVYSDLNKVLSDGVGCANGHKFVIKPQKGDLG